MYSIRTPISTANSVAPGRVHLLLADFVAVVLAILVPVARSWMTNPT